MEKFSRVAVGLFFIASSAFAQAQSCLQDQYGNKYSFTVDPAHQYLYGSMTRYSAEPCGAQVWPLTGSYITTEAGTGLELTVANPAASADTYCVVQYKLKGKFPNFQWYYPNGPSTGDLPAVWKSCSAPPEGIATGRNGLK